MNNQNPKQYTGTKGLSLTIVIGAAIGTVIGKLMDNMNTGLMIGLILGVCGWVLFFNRRKPQDTPGEQTQPEEEEKQDSDNKRAR